MFHSVEFIDLANERLKFSFDLRSPTPFFRVNNSMNAFADSSFGSSLVRSEQVDTFSRDC